MKYLLPIETDRAYDWAYENGLSFVNAEMAYYLGYHDLWDDSYCPDEIEIEFDVIPESSTAHPYGSTVAIERHISEITCFEVDGKPVTVPEWLEEKLMEKA